METLLFLAYGEAFSFVFQDILLMAPGPAGQNMEHVCRIDNNIKHINKAYVFRITQGIINGIKIIHNTAHIINSLLNYRYFIHKQITRNYNSLHTA